MNDKTTQPREQAITGNPHDVVIALREYADNPGYSHNDYADTMRQAAHCIESLRAMFYHYGAITQQAAPEAPTLPDSRAMHIKDKVVDEPVDEHDRYFFRLGWNACRSAVASTGAAPLVQEVAASEQRFFMDHGVWHDRVTGQHMWTQDQYDEQWRDMYKAGQEDATIGHNMLTGKAITPAATTESASEWCGECVGQGIKTSPVPPDGDDTCEACNGTGRATAPSRNAAPLDEITRYDAITKGDGSGYVKFGVSSEGRYVKFDDARAALTQQSAAQAPSAYIEKQAARYRWLRDKSEPGICAFYLSVGQAFKDVKFTKETVDDAIDAQIAAMSAATEQKEKP